MAKSTKRGIDEVDTYNSDGGFVVDDNDDSDEAPKSKKTKKEGKPNAKSTVEAERKFWALSSGRNPRRIEISELRDVKLINIREYYEKDEQMLPGKKGISLTIEQYKALLRAIPQVNANLRKMGIEVEAEAAGVEDSEADEATQPAKRVKAKKSKANIEATSDEEE